MSAGQKPAPPVLATRAVKARVGALLLPGLGQLVLRRYAVGAALLFLTATNLVFIALCLVRLCQAVAAAVASAADGGVLDDRAYLVPAVKLLIEVTILLGLYIWGFVDVTLALRREAAR